MATKKNAATEAKRGSAMAQAMLQRGDWRIKAVFGFLALLGVLLVMRIADHQVLMNHAFLEKQGEARTVRTEKFKRTAA
ncbi:MAG: hypothetical protein R3E67_04360 [Pseudomonadales bacterium]